MDALAGLLDGPRSRGAFLLRVVMDPPWAIRVADEAPLTLMAVVEGEACVVPADGEPVALGPGDLAIARGSAPYTVGDRADTPPQAIIEPGQHCRSLTGQDLTQTMGLGLRTWGNAAGGSTVLITGTYEATTAAGLRLLGALPDLLVVPSASLDSPLPGLLAHEVARDVPGQAVVLDRLLDLLVITAVRAWLARPDADAPTWYQAHGDPVVGPALRLLHNEPAHPWTVADLAARCGASRAAFARRFTELVGEPPMTYLAGWRLAIAADLLRDRDTTLDAIAGQVGYSSGFALSNAFTRVQGVSPSEHRRLARVES